MQLFHHTLILYRFLKIIPSEYLILLIKFTLLEILFPSPQKTTLNEKVSFGPRYKVKSPSDTFEATEVD
jgi:hypothetical protein